MSTFSQKVYKAVKKIPKGEVRTYGWIAEQIGHPRAARAVGNALNKNPSLITIPCHRVVAKNGLGGYVKGLEAKKKLLKREAPRLLEGLLY